MINQILTCNTHKRNYRQYILSAARATFGSAMPAIQWGTVDQQHPVVAWVYRGYWVVTCECRGQVYYEPGEPFFCPDCLNVLTAGTPRAVLMPENRAEAERLLCERPNMENRNWEPGESVAVLETENQIFIHKGG